MGYTGSYTIGLNHYQEWKHTGTTAGLTFSNLIAAIRGRSITINELKDILGENFDIGFSSYDLRRLLEANAVLSNLFEYRTGELKYILKYEKKDFYDNGFGIIRVYDPNNCPDNEVLVQRDLTSFPERQMCNSSSLTHDKFEEIISCAKYEIDVFGQWSDRARLGEMTHEDFIRTVLSIHNEKDVAAIKITAFFEKEILKLLQNKSFIEELDGCSKIRDFVVSQMEEGNEEKSVFVLYENGYLRFYNQTQTEILFEYKTRLFFKLCYIFGDGLCNYQTLSSVEEAKKFEKHMEYMYSSTEEFLKYPRNKDIQNMVHCEIVDAKKENRDVNICFEGSY